MNAFTPTTPVNFLYGEVYLHGRVIADLGAKIQICSKHGMHLIPREYVTREQANNPMDILNQIFGGQS